MSTPSRKPFALAAAVMIAMTAACGDDADEPDDTDEGVTGETRHATLEVLEGWTEVLPDATGEAVVTTDDGTTVELSVTGMQPDTEYPAHVHAGTCDDDPPGGEHWSAGTDGGDVPDPGGPTHLHTYVITDANGEGAMTDSSDLVVDDRALSIVVHAAGSNELLQAAGSDRIFCGDLESR